MKGKFAAAALAMGLLSACASPKAAAPTRPVATRPPPPRQPAAPVANAFIAPRVMNLPGLEPVIGQGANALVALFGQPRLDVWEADARKLQFSGTACTLDVFLYPLSPGIAESATWVEARRSDGRDVDRAACVAALRR